MISTYMYVTVYMYLHLLYAFMPYLFLNLFRISGLNGLSVIFFWILKISRNVFGMFTEKRYAIHTHVQGSTVYLIELYIFMFTVCILNFYLFFKYFNLILNIYIFIHSYRNIISFCFDIWTDSFCRKQKWLCWYIYIYIFIHSYRDIISFCFDRWTDSFCRKQKWLCWYVAVTTPWRKSIGSLIKI